MENDYKMREEDQSADQKNNHLINHSSASKDSLFLMNNSGTTWRKMQPTNTRNNKKVK